jgi:Ca-activated chloride channel family protein
MPKSRKNRSSLAFRGGILTLVLLGCVFAPAVVALQTSKSSDKGVKGGQQGTLKLQSDLVVVSATVTDAAGHYVKGLRASDFSVLEDNTPQQIASISSEEAPFAAAILIDTSGSMEFKFGMVRGAAAAFLEHIGEDDQVAVYGFNDKVRQFQDFSNVRDLSDYVWDAKAEDDTRLFDCMETAIAALGKRPERRRAELVITDGCDNISGGTKDSVVKKALNEAVTLYTVDLVDDEYLIGSGIGAETLRRGRVDMQELARQTGGRYIHNPQGDTLEGDFDGVVEELRNQYTLTYYSTNARHDGHWRGIALSVPRPGMSVRARRGYYAPKG